MKACHLTALFCLALAPAQAQTQRVLPGMPAPLTYVQNMEKLDGKTLLLKSVRCEAPMKPITEGRLYLTMLPGNRVRAARLEYNEQGKYVLENGQNTPLVKRYFEQYIKGQQPFSTFTLNTLISLWRAFGTRFSFEEITYSCQLS